jgi:UDP-2-acetamido-2-deoxy-ribo-hexuluronate aminotransferase
MRTGKLTGASNLAIELRNAFQMDIPFIDLRTQYERLRPRVLERMVRVLDHGAYIMGPEIAELESALAALTGACHVVSVSSGTDALLMALMAEGIGIGDAVFVPAFTFTASAETIILTGATPVFVDVDPATFNIDPDDLRARIEETLLVKKLKPRAIIAVDLFGLPASYADIGSIASEFGIFVIADAAQSLGGAIGNSRVGTLAPVTATSFFPAKPLGGYGDSGALFCESSDLADRLRSIRSHGAGSEKYEIERIGLNGRMDTLQAAILLAKLEIFPDELATRERIANAYDSRLADYVDIPYRGETARSAWAQYTIKVRNRDQVSRDLQERGIPTRVYYPKPMHLQAAYSDLADGIGSFPVSEELSSTVLSLPMHPYLNDETIETICREIVDVLKH